MLPKVGYPGHFSNGAVKRHVHQSCILFWLFVEVLAIRTFSFLVIVTFELMEAHVLGSYVSKRPLNILLALLGVVFSCFKQVIFT